MSVPTKGNLGLSGNKRALLEALLQEEGLNSVPFARIAPRQSSGLSPLSFAQDRLWYLDQLEPNTTLYTISCALRLEGELNVSALERALNETVKRHEVLRTTFCAVNGEPFQRINPVRTLEFPIVDLQHFPAAEQDREVRRLVRDRADMPFQLETGPLFRTKLLKLAPNDHVLLLNVHHIVADDWSFGVLHGELTSLYNAFASGTSVSLPNLSIQYADFSEWQKQSLQGGVLKEQISYWKRQLTGAPAVLALPLDRPRPSVQTCAGAAKSFALPVELSAQLQALALKEGVTLFMLLLAAFKTVLYRYSHQDDVVVGSPIANRNRVEIENLIGFFVNTLVLRTRLSGNPTFRELLRRVREVALGAYEHQDFPLEKLVEELRPERSLSYSPLFQVMFVLQNPSLPEFNLSGLTSSYLNIERTGAKFDISLYMYEVGDGIQGLLEYNTDLFDAPTIERLLLHYRAVLEAVVIDPDQRVDQISLLTPAERQEILAKWNDTDVASPEHDRCVHHLIEMQADRDPHRVALIFDQQQLTYGQLNSRANQLAHYLRKQGIGPDVLVGVFLERSIEMVVALLGILKAGGAYLPLDPAYPKDRLAFMLEDAQAPVLLTETRLASQLPAHSAKVFCFDRDAKLIEQEASTNLEEEAGPENLIYTIYTSGSTGKPKGVGNTQQGVVNRLLWMQGQYKLDQTDRVMQKTPYSFDVSVWEFFWPLMTGASLVVARPEGHKDPSYLANLIEEQQITTMHFVPSMLRMFLETEGLEKQCSSLRRVFCSGEALPYDLQERFFERLKKVELHNLYGPTEAAVDVTAWHCRQDSRLTTVPIGKPIWNTQIYILDPQLQPVPVGITGELHIGGMGLARGYLNRPELTAEKFISDPFSPKPGARLYKTGDLARFLADGNIEYLGRLDHQVKIRGFRIELGEIEASLESYPGIGQCVVVAREDQPGDKRLVAYFEWPATSAPLAGELREHLKKSLPDYMVPSAFVSMENLPLTTSGKVDRKALPLPGDSRIESKRNFVGPSDSVEQVLTHLWSKILKVNRIGVNDNFFELGGHSLLAVRVIVEIEKIYKRRLPLATLLQAQTIAELAQVVRREDWKPSWSSLVPLRPGGSRPPFFLMHSHGGNVLEYFALANLFDPDQPIYALQARGLDGTIIKDRLIEEMAADYLAEIQTLQPEGPYFLGGFCYGGLLALEVAHQLAAAGEEVGLVAMLQTKTPQTEFFLPGTSLAKQWWHRTAKRLDLERENMNSRGPKYIRERARHAWDKVSARAVMAIRGLNGNDQTQKTGTNRQPSSFMPYILQCLAVEHDKAYEKYVPQPYFGDVILLRASKQLPGLGSDPFLGWKDILLGNFEVREVPGHQQNILIEPNLSRLADELTQRLEAAQRSNGEQAEKRLLEVSKT